MLHNGFDLSLWNWRIKNVEWNDVFKRRKNGLEYFDCKGRVKRLHWLLKLSLWSSFVVHRWHVEQQLQLFNDLTQISNIIIEKRLSCKATFTTIFLLSLMPINVNDCATKLFVYHTNLLFKTQRTFMDVLENNEKTEKLARIESAFKMHTGKFTI